MFLRILILFWFLSIPALVGAQALVPVYQQFTEQNGLPSNYLNCLFQDSKGFIWIGSDKGLTRFDGINFKTYTTDDGLSGNMILDIEEDASGNLWIGTFERGLCRFDGKQFDCWGKTDGLNTIGTILKPIDHKIFYSAGSKKLAWFDLDKKSHHTVFDLPAYGADNSVIPVGDSGVLFPCGNTIFLVSPKGDTTELLYEKNKNSFLIKTGLVDTDGKIWLSDSQNKQLLSVDIQGNQLLVTDTLPGVGTGAKIFRGRDGFIENYAKNNYYSIIHSKNESIQKISNPHPGQNHDILLDREGQLWLATVGYGLFVQKGAPYLHQLPQQNGAAYDIEILPDGHILVGGDHGIWMYNKDLKPEGFQSEIEQVRGIKSLDGFGIVAGTLQGATYIFKNKKAILNKNKTTDFFVSSGFSGGLSLENGKGLFSSYGAGLKVYANQNITAYELPSLPNLMVEGLFQTSHGNWATSSSDGVLLFDKNSNRLFSKEKGLTSNNVYTVFESHKDSVWIGTENGATRWNGKNQLSTFTKTDGLDGGRITAFFKDKHAQLWAFSDQYLHRWSDNRWKAFKSISFQNVPEGRVYDVAYDSTYHRVFIASTTGGFVLELDQLETKDTPVDFVLESIKSQKGKLKIDELNVLAANDNSIQIDFSIPSFTRSSNNDCYFRLLENGENWTKATEPSSFQFNHLPSGHYTLEAMTENPDGIRSQIKTLAKFKILRPIWLRWWAVLLEILLGIGVVAGIVAWYFKQKEEKRLAALQVERELQAERERISRDLHDNIGAQLTNITFKLDLAAHQTKDEKDSVQIEKIGDDTRDTIKLLRDTIWALQKDEFSLNDLANKLEIYVNRLEGLDVKFKISRSITTDWMLSPKEVLHVFRIIQEAIQNIIKHAEASEALIIFTSDADSFEIKIADNGKGFSPLSKNGVGHYGLENMAFRAKEIGANFSINQNNPKGTQIQILKTQ